MRYCIRREVISSMVGIPEMSSMAYGLWWGLWIEFWGDTLDSYIHGKLTCLCELIPPTTLRLTLSFFLSFNIAYNKTTIQVCIARAKFKHVKWQRRRPIILTLKKHWNIRRYPPRPYARLKYLMVEVELAPLFKDTELNISCFMGVAYCIVGTSDVGGGHTWSSRVVWLCSYAATPLTSRVLTCH